MKKILSLMIVLTMCLSFAACGGSSAQAPEAEAPEAEAPEAEAPEEIRYSQTVCLHPTGGEGYLYEQPDEEAAVLSPLATFAEVYALKSAGDWTYCVSGLYEGWTDFPLAGSYSETIPLPDFLDGEQQVLFVKALSMFNAFHNYMAGPYGFANETNDPYPDIYYTSLDEVRTALETVFTADYVRSDFLPDSPDAQYMVKEENGQLWYNAGGRGSFYADPVGYELDEQTDGRVAFRMILDYGGTGEWRCEMPIEMVKTGDGWRFAKMSSGRDDGSWMEAMGPDFDPWAVMADMEENAVG